MNLAHRLNDDIQTLPFYLAILLNLVLNLYLIGQIVQRKHFYTSPKYTVMLTMAVADILQAELPFIIACRKTVMLESDRLTDMEEMVGKFYINHLVHFVYGLSLILLGAELVTRQKLKGWNHKSLLAVTTSCIPWAVSVLAVLIFNFDKKYGYFFSQQSLVLSTAVCVFLPAISAFIKSAGIFVTHFWADDEYGGLTQCTDFLAVLKDIYDVIIGGNARNNSHSLITYRHKVIVDSSETNFSTKSSAQTSYIIAQAQKSTVSTHSDEDKLNTIVKTEPRCHNKDVQRDVTHMIKLIIRKEIDELFALSLAFAVTVLPYHIFSLLETVDHVTVYYKLTVDVLRWIMFSRSFITPFIMLRFLTQEKFKYIASFEMTIT